MANSQWTARRFKENNPEYASANIRVCHLGVTPAAVVADPAPREGYALIVGRLAASERYKGHDALIDVWPRVRQVVPTAELLIVGDGDDRERLQARVRSMGLSESVRFAGRVSNSVLAGLYRNAAFFAMPSLGEGFGLTFLEAMRAGKPCVAGPGAAAEIVEDGVTGFIVDPADRDRLTAAIIQLFQEPETRAAMGKAGAARVQAEFETRHFASRVLGELSEALVHA
jgi:phosphatidylinositol alpha-1,6-mannosyltransferase